MKSYTIFWGAWFLSISCLFAQNPPSKNLQDSYFINIQRIKEKITIDGDLAESTWASTEVATDFWMSFPEDQNRAAKEIQTEVRAAYDDNFLYFGVVCYDSEDHIIQTRKRDSQLFWRGDAFAVVIDPVNERSNGFSFGVNPENVQTESLISGRTGRRGDNRPGRPPTGVNSAWDNKWFSKVQLYEDRWTIEIAIPFKSLRFKAQRKTWGVNFIRGEAESNSYHTWAPVPVQFRGVDLGYTGALQWDEAPKKVKSNISIIPYLLGSTAKDFEEGTNAENVGRGGLDAKVAITSSLNLDLTINPDFSQVEVDRQVTNLTRFNIRFPERRLFFLENSDIYSDFGIPPMRPFFSRRIGLDSEGNALPINYGARLSGNINKDLRIGLMNLQTRDSDVQSAQNYTSFAIHQRVLKRSLIKAYFHNRQATAEGEFMKEDYNRVGGIELAYQSADGKVRGFGGYGLSLGPENNTSNFFYNIGGGYDGRNISAYSNLAGVGDNYIADMGFIPLQLHYDAVADTSYRLGFHHWFSRFSYTLYPENEKVNFHRIGARNVFDMTLNDEIFLNNAEFAYTLQMANTSGLSVQVNHETINLLFPFGFTDETPLPVGKYTFGYAAIRYQTDSRKKLGLQVGLQYGEFYNGTRAQYSLGLTYRVQPWGNFALEFEQNDLQFPDPYGEERLFLISPRIEINFSRALFWTTFLQYNTQRDNFNINSRLQWRFQPMSDLFIVYTDNYAVEFWGPKTRALVVKLNYWFNL